MRSTLFFVPHEVWGIPLFGFGLCLALVSIAWAAWVAWCIFRKKPKEEWIGSLPVLGIAAAVIIFVLPAVEQRWPDGTAIGLPIRGYGVMVLLGLLAGVGITVYRGNQLGIKADTIIGLGFWMMLIGVIGARVFYVLQKWNEFGSWGEVFQVTEGGLVIYGGVIGGLVAGIAYCLRHQLKVWAMADLITPGFLLGLGFGRIGCLLHGCCFGGVCDAQLPTIRFAHGTVPYQAQLASGEILGIDVDGKPLPARITRIRPKSPAAEVGIQPGQMLYELRLEATVPQAGSDPTAPPNFYARLKVDGQSFVLPPESLPALSRPTHPSQIYSAINAVLLCCLLWFLQPAPTRDGVVFCVGIMLYAFSRFLLEGVRSDEAGQLGTDLTIAQWVGVVSILLAAAALAMILRGPAGRSLAWGNHTQMAKSA